MRKILFLLLFLIISHNVEAVVGLPVSRTWQNAFFGGGGSYPRIVADSKVPNRIYTISDVSGALVSSDKAENWSYMNGGITTIINYAFAQSAVNPRIMYVLGKKFSKSTDGGITWNQVATFTGNPTMRGTRTIVFDPNDVNVVYVAISDGTIRKTVDGGVNWTTYATPWGSNIVPSFLYIDRTSTYLFVGSNYNPGSSPTGIKRYLLVDGTSTTISLTGTNATRNTDISSYMVGSTEHICVSAGFHISCTDDNGSNWTDTSDITADSTFFIFRMEVRYLASTSVRMIAYARRISTPYGTNIAVVSDDGGSTWTSFWDNVTVDLINNPSNTWANFGTLGNVYSLASDPFDEEVWYATTDWRIFRSDDGGNNWSEKIKGAMNTVITDVTVSPNGRIFACGMDVGLYYSDNNGSTWTASLPHISNGDPQGFDLAGHYWKVLTTGTEAEWNAGNGHVLVTFSPYITGTLFAPKIYRSVDNGVTWVDSSSGLPTTKLDSNAGASDQNKACWGIGYPRSFAKLNSDENIMYVGIDGYSATENGGIFKSTDNGQTWVRTTQPTSWRIYNGLSVNQADSTGNTVAFSEFFAASGHSPHFYISTNGGVTWTESDVISYGSYEISFNSVGNLYATGLYSGPEVYYATDGSLGTWGFMQQLNTTANIGDALLVDPQDDNRLFAGVNDGTSTAGNGTGDGNGGSVYMTDRALSFSNATWTEITGDLPNPSGVQALAINYHANDDGYLFATTDGSGIFRLDLSDTSTTTVSNIHIP